MRTHMSHATALAYDRAGAGKNYLIRRYLFSLFAIVSAGAITDRAHAQAPAGTGVVAGVISGGTTDTPLDGVQVTIVGTTLGRLTGADGRFRLQGVSGSEATLRATRIGFKPAEQRVRVGDTDVRITLVETALTLDQLDHIQSQDVLLRPRTSIVASALLLSLRISRSLRTHDRPRYRSVVVAASPG